MVQNSILGVAGRSGGLHANELNLKDKRREGRDGALSLFAVSEIPRDIYFPLAAHFHVGQGDGPALNHLVGTKLYGLLVRRVKNSAIDELTFILHLYNFVCLGRCASTGLNFLVVHTASELLYTWSFGHLSDVVLALLLGLAKELFVGRSTHFLHHVLEHRLNAFARHRVLTDHEAAIAVLRIEHTSEELLRREMLGAIARKHLALNLSKHSLLDLQTALHTKAISDVLLIVRGVHTIFQALEEVVYKGRITTALEQVLDNFLLSGAIGHTQSVAQRVDFVRKAWLGIISAIAGAQQRCCCHEGSEEDFFHCMVVLICLFVDAQQFYVKNECGIGRNAASCTLCTIGEVEGNEKTEL